MVNSRVARYWPGKAPRYSENPEDSENIDEDDSEEQSKPQTSTQTNTSRIRIQLHDKENQTTDHDEDEEVGADQNQMEDNQGQMDEESDPDEDPDSRRARIRERLRQRQQQEEEMIKEFQGEQEEDEEEEESESEYESESDDEYGRFPVLAPVFVSKQERETILERERQEQEEERKEREREVQLEERKKETKNLLIEELTRQQNQAQDNKGIAEVEVEDVDTSEGSEDEQSAEFEKWKIRELLRIKHDRESRDAHEKEQDEIEKRRQMTDAEIKELDKDLLKPKQKSKWKFLQKYYHKGAFFQDENEEIYKRDVSAPTGDDRFDKSILPAVKQVKNFGRAGRTKYTHLVDQDTTSWDSPWVLPDHLRAKYTSKMGGMGAVDQNAIPRKRKRNPE